MNIAIIQARMASKRLPGKAMLDICGSPLINYVLERAKNIKNIDEVFLATSSSPENDELSSYVEKNGVKVYRGDEDDVVGRMYQIIEDINPENILRITGDNPLIDPNIIDSILASHLKDKNDYSCTSAFPVGLTGDIFSRQALVDTHKLANGKELQDHVDMYILNNQEKYKCACYFLDRYMSNYRFTVDDKEDLDRIISLNNFLLSKEKEMINMNFKSILEIVADAVWEKKLQPKSANISKENLETYKLVKDIKNRQPVWFNDL